MATALPLATAFTDAATTEGQEKTALGNLRASLAEIGDPMGRAGAIQNLSLAFSVAANALTCNVKTRAGAAPSATDPVSAAMRNATVATGDFNVRNVTAALALVISSGSTLGHLSTVAAPIFWYLIDNAGTLELAASTTYFGPNGIVTTTAEGGAGAADSAVIMYSTAARSNVPFICVGRTTDTQTTAGTWTAVPSVAELWPFDARIATFIEQATTSGTSIDVTGIPSWVKRITMMFAGVSTTGAPPSVQIGDSGGIETASYLTATSILTNAAAVAVANNVAGFAFANNSDPAAVFHGSMVLTLEDASDNTWTATWSIGRSDATIFINGAGSKALSAPLDRVRLTTTNGTATFDAGSFNILYE